MTARAAARDIASPASPVSVVGVDGDGEGLEGLEATVAGDVDVDDVVVASGCVGEGAVATGEAEVRSISASREESK